ncbi:putative Avr9/Cf-9 rapidly elicited protein [Quillaja saponaria]|uniref:Avr9/Cf-9 rapidly elicited protein n=1 Tax=Quillaja saponaria TaxID=32244 RepID=A0AAD7LEN4_QUISA|nr:putative Avr9/Cf-9 rapidly elicited protein [Quillaja saponaria]
MDCSESEFSTCRKHRNQKEVPGVCSFCLRERLSQLDVSSNTKKPITPYSYSSSLSSSPDLYTSLPSSNFVSPAYHSRRHHHRNTSDVTGSVSFMFSVNYELRKSKSVANASRSRGRDDTSGNWGKKKDGFWSRIFRLTKKKSK